MANYRGNETRIVRIFNDEIYVMVDLVAEYHNVPVQHVFDVLCEMIINGDNMTIDILARLSEPIVEIAE
jgi:hypothetical protein